MIMTVMLVDPPPPADPVTPLVPAHPSPPSPPNPPPPPHISRPTPVPPDIPPVAAGKGPISDTASEVSDAQLASASTADSGPPGGACNMTRWLQSKLRKDRLVQAALADTHPGKAIMIWNGDWIKHDGQDGNGLAAVRESIMWEVAFAPAACRAEPVHGLVLISLNDGPGSTRIVVGSGAWRWSDLLF
jgi:hypothetical protein